MNNELKIVRLDSSYCEYLRKFEPKVPYNFHEKELRPFIGVLFEVNKCKYFAPLSSPKPKHLNMKNSVDFLRLDAGKLGAINFNNMLPVSDDNIIYIDLNKKTTNKNDEKYQNLLKEQLYWLNRHSSSLYTRAIKLYNGYLNKTLPNRMLERCCDFVLLEKKCIEYNVK